MIHNYVGGRLLKTLPKRKLPSFFIEPAETADDESDTARRIAAPLLAVAERRRTFAEVELAPAECEARQEARRCLRCDLDFTRPG
jgi:NADH-quinone oxidoreductase subunit F